MHWWRARGAYMAEIFGGDRNTFRRVFAMWSGWSGRDFCGVAWPNGNNVGVYNASGSTVENVIAHGRSLKGILVQSNSDAAISSNNHVLGSIAVLQGRNYDGSVDLRDRPAAADRAAWADNLHRHYVVGLAGAAVRDGAVRAGHDAGQRLPRRSGGR